MTVSIYSSKVLASLRLEEQDVTRTSSKTSIIEALLQMAKSSIEKKLKFLVEIPRLHLNGKDKQCKCYPHAVCEEWTMDEDTIRSAFYEGNYELVVYYINGIINNGPIGVHCIWIDGHECVWGACNSE